MLAGIRALPLSDFDTFTRDPHTAAAAESYVRRAVEALVDLGRHLLAKRFGMAVSQYKAIPAALAEAGVLETGAVGRFTEICGYRNRLVHFYHAVSDRELYDVCTTHAADIETLLAALLAWIEEHPDPDPA
jgi:uncharacterized protein YutE (UPF0331/DUF86 family)